MGGSTSEGNNKSAKKCGLGELVIFIAAIVAGTACSICSKTMMQLHGVGLTGEVEQFSKPIFQTFGMFVGMMFGLVMHWLVLLLKIPFPGYEHITVPVPSATLLPLNSASVVATEKDSLLKRNNGTASSTEPCSAPRTTPLWMYFFLAIPSIFDLAATALCMMGLRYLDVSIYQLLRGSGIIFVALMKQHVLGDHLYKFQWIGVFWNVISVVLVGSTAILNSARDQASVEPGEAFLGVLLVMTGAFVQALQFVFEEKVMTMDDVAAPPLLLIGMEGLWGTVLCLLVVYPLVYYIPGSDHGSYEDPYNTWDMFVNSKNIQLAFVVYFFAIFAYNLFAVLVTFMLNSVWRTCTTCIVLRWVLCRCGVLAHSISPSVVFADAILDNFRPITVWCTDMFIYYVITTQGDFGEPWTQWSYVQLLGMCVLLYGTAVYNAPNAGSVRLEGQWFALGMDLKHEYDEIELESHQAEQDREWEERQRNFMLRRPSSIPGDPTFASVHVPAHHYHHRGDVIPPRNVGTAAT